MTIRSTSLCSLVLVALTGCQQGLERQSPGTSRIAITAEAGSEVVITKYGGAPSPTLQHAAEPELLLAPIDSISAPLPLNEPPPLRQESTLASLQLESNPPPMPLGRIEEEVWTLRQGETLSAAINRLRQRAGYALSADDDLPRWVITEPAEYRGDFRDMLVWLMDGFAHTVPRPVITLHPNSLLRLEAE